jgi:hypothetical protein
LARPTGGGSFCAGFHSLQGASGVAGYIYNVANFNPLQDGSAVQKGGIIHAALKKYSSAFATYAPFIALMSGLSVQTSEAYILGLSTTSPYQIVLKKGTLVAGLGPSDVGVLRASDESFSAAEWLHLRLDVIVNPHGDVVLNVYQNDPLTDVTAPSWGAISGMDQYIDDALGVLTTGTPLTSGLRAVIGCYFGGTAGQVGLHDHIVVGRQLTP